MYVYMVLIKPQAGAHDENILLGQSWVIQSVFK
jgi:hypothetical protein